MSSWFSERSYLSRYSEKGSRTLSGLHVHLHTPVSHLHAHTYTHRQQNQQQNQQPQNEPPECLCWVCFHDNIEAGRPLAHKQVIKQGDRERVLLGFVMGYCRVVLGSWRPAFSLGKTMLVPPLLMYWIVLGEFLCLSETWFPSPRMGTEIGL